jgi:hypothetical protein
MEFDLGPIYGLFIRFSVEYLRQGMSQQTLQTSRQSWRDLYVAAPFETDTNRMPARIAAAETAIVSRVRELFSVGSDTIEEDQALDDALYALRALQNRLEMRVLA